MAVSLTTLTVADAIATLRDRYQADRDAVRTQLESRGCDVVPMVSRPPSNQELRNDYWWYCGMLVALEVLTDILDIG